VSRALAAVNVSQLARLTDITTAYQNQIADLVAFQKQLQSTTSPLLKIQAEYAQLLSRFDVSWSIVAEQVINRLGSPLSVFTRQLIQQITFPATNVAQQALRALVPTTQMIVQFQAQFDAVSKGVHQALWRDLAPLRQLAESIGRGQAVRDAFVTYGLWLAPSMPEEIVQKVVAAHSRKATSATVHSTLSRFYARDNWKLLDNIVDACRNNPLIARRSDSIREAVQAHREGLYAVSVPSLLLHVEGIAADYVKAKQLMPKIGRKTREIIVAALNETPCSLFDVRTYAGVAALLVYIQESMYVYVDFDGDHQRLRREKRLVAHAIRHGRQVSYGSRMNSLRLFLMIDVLSLLT
jgi:hypothetical protein